MGDSGIIIILTAIGTGGVFLYYRPLIASSSWRATVTPLASIMGSGFLVCIPLLYANVGNYAVFAIAALLCLAYAVGSVMRFNIRYAEPLLETQELSAKNNRIEHRLHIAHRDAASRVKAAGTLELLERTSHFALAGAYCVSVSYYLQLLASFALQSFSPEGHWFGKVLVTIILAGIGGIGATRGLLGIERMERIVVGINLAMIAALVAGLIYYNISAAAQGTWRLCTMVLPQDRLHTIRFLMGMLIVVQGFETSRFLGTEHSREERIRTMKWAQLISSGIYILFIGLMAVVVCKAKNIDQTGITAIVGFSKIVAPILPILLTITAIASQLSAATADDAGCSGLLESIFRHRIHVRYDYIIVSVMSIVFTWITDVYQIISFASRAFAFYYALQCIVAIMVIRRVPLVKAPGRKTILFGSLAAVCAAVTLMGIPAG